jgi:hypothetical protein
MPSVSGAESEFQYVALPGQAEEHWGWVFRKRARRRYIMAVEIPSYSAVAIKFGRLTPVASSACIAAARLQAMSHSSSEAVSTSGLKGIPRCENCMCNRSTG